MFKAIASFLDVFSRAWIEYRGYDLGDLNLMIAFRRERYGSDTTKFTFLEYLVREGGKEIVRQVGAVISEIGGPDRRELSRNVLEFRLPRHDKEAELVREYAKKWYSTKGSGPLSGKKEREREILGEVCRLIETREKELKALRDARVLQPTSE